MIDLINEKFVPVWIDIRVTPVPAVAAIRETFEGIDLDPRGTVIQGFSRGFLVRSVVLSPRDERLLNRQRLDGPVARFFENGFFPYAQVKPADYGSMLRNALDRQGSSNNAAPAAGSIR